MRFGLHFPTSFLAARTPRDGKAGATSPATGEWVAPANNEQPLPLWEWRFVPACGSTERPAGSMRIPTSDWFGTLSGAHQSVLTKFNTQACPRRATGDQSNGPAPS
jgi:hypothetical protein